MLSGEQPLPILYASALFESVTGAVFISERVFMEGRILSTNAIFHFKRVIYDSFLPKIGRIHSSYRTLFRVTFSDYIYTYIASVL